MTFTPSATGGVLATGKGGHQPIASIIPANLGVAIEWAGFAQQASHHLYGPVPLGYCRRAG